MNTQSTERGASRVREVEAIAVESPFYSEPNAERM